MSHLRPAVLLLLLLTLLTGLAYPLLTTALANWLFSPQAHGSLIYAEGRAVGSALIGQPFSHDNYFWGRPSATSAAPYNTLASGGSNLAGSNPALDQALADRIAALRAAHPDSPAAVPVDLVTASGSGLDPHISPEAARWQIPRIARVRHLPPATLERLVAAQTETPFPALLGEPVVNVLELNRALDALKG